MKKAFLYVVVLVISVFSSIMPSHASIGAEFPIATTGSREYAFSAAFSATLTPDGPDLTGSWISLTQTCKATKKGVKCKIKGKSNIQNIGNSDAKSSFVRFYLSDDNTFGEEDIFLKQVATGKIKPGKNKNKNLRYSFPKGSSVSGKYVIAIIDADNTILEINENNNYITYGPIPFNL